MESAMEPKAGRGQSSLEFLMTYGWAILMIIIAVLIAWQWGLFSIGETVSPGAFGFWGVEPSDFIMHADGTFEVTLINNVGANVTLTYYNASMGDGVCACGTVCAPTCSYVISPDKVQKLTLTGLTQVPSGRRFETYFILKYNDLRTGNVEYTSSGKIWGAVED